MSYIYIVTNNINGKQYVGQHRYEGDGLDPSYKGSGKALWKAYDKYGIENFTISMLEECEDDQLNVLEPYYIDTYGTMKPNGYNLTMGGDGVSGFTHSEETRRKLSESHKGKKLPPEAVEKLRQRLIGHTTSESAKRKISESLKGRQFTDERRANISKALMGNTPWNKGMTGVMSEESRGKLRQALTNNGKTSRETAQYRLDGTLVGIYPSSAEAGRQSGVRKSHIVECCNGKRKTAGGYVWKYADETKKAAC